MNSFKKYIYLFQINNKYVHSVREIVGGQCELNLVLYNKLNTLRPYHTIFNYFQHITRSIINSGGAPGQVQTN